MSADLLAMLAYSLVKMASSASVGVSFESLPVGRSHQALVLVSIDEDLPSLWK